MITIKMVGLQRALDNLRGTRSGLAKMDVHDIAEYTARIARRNLIGSLVNNWPSDGSPGLRSPEGIRTEKLGIGKWAVVASSFSPEGFDYSSAVEMGRKEIVSDNVMVFPAPGGQIIQTHHVNRAAGKGYMRKARDEVARRFRGFMEAKTSRVIRSRGADVGLGIQL